ncbi:MAG: hypothetical protein PHE67_04140 [Campylobacterales bacterium]|nr:hypothetical protein [Campylobacterales bacterium]
MTKKIILSCIFLVGILFADAEHLAENNNSYDASLQNLSESLKVVSKALVKVIKEQKDLQKRLNDVDKNHHDLKTVVDNITFPTPTTEVEESVQIKDLGQKLKNTKEPASKIERY